MFTYEVNWNWSVAYIFKNRWLIFCMHISHWYPSTWQNLSETLRISIGTGSQKCGIWNVSLQCIWHCHDLKFNCKGLSSQSFYTHEVPLSCHQKPAYHYQFEANKIKFKFLAGVNRRKHILKNFKAIRKKKRKS